MDTFKQDGFEFARLSCSYYITESGHTIIQDMVYLMRRDENRQWKIYGWDQAENVNVGTESQEGEQSGAE